MKTRVASLCGALLMIVGCAGVPTASTPVKSIKVNETELAYVEKGQGVPVVFVHGTLEDLRMWDGQVDAFAERYHVYAYSRRYHYPNSWVGDASDYTRPKFAAELVALLQRLDVGPAHLIGHSYGGVVAAIVAAEHPELVRSLVVIEPPMPSFVPRSDAGKVALAQFGEAMGNVRALIKKGDTESAVKAFTDYIFSPRGFDAESIHERQAKMDNIRTLPPNMQDPTASTAFTCDTARRVKAPVLMVHGELSPKVFHLVLDGLGDCLPKSELHVVNGATHGMQSDDPAAFNKAVLEFLSRH